MYGVTLYMFLFEFWLLTYLEIYVGNIMQHLPRNLGRRKRPGGPLGSKGNESRLEDRANPPGSLSSEWR